MIYLSRVKKRKVNKMIDKLIKWFYPEDSEEHSFKDVAFLLGGAIIVVPSMFLAFGLVLSFA